MVCRHLEQLSMDIKAQGILENSNETNETEDVYTSVSVDCYLDRKSIRQKHNFPDFVTNYTASETEGTVKEGFVCNQCKDAIIGLHQGFMPGCKSFGYNDTGEPYVFYFDDTQSPAEPKEQEALPEEKSTKRSIGLFIFAVLLGSPIALYQYIPNNMKLGFVAGICTLILVPFILSPVTQKIRGKGRYRFPFANIIMVLLIGMPVFILWGWKPLYYFLAGCSVLALFGSIILRITRGKA